MRTATAFVAVFAIGAAVQGVPTITLSKPDATYGEPLSQVAGLRELSDGRIVIADRLEKTVSIVNLRTGAVTPIGREGQGPGEYQSPGAVFALPADTSLLVDIGNMRGLLLTPDGQVGETVSFLLGEAQMFPRGVDGRGRLYSQPPMMFNGGSAMTLPDSIPIVRIGRNGSVDTVAWVASPHINLGSGGQFRVAGGPALSLRSNPYEPRDTWAVAPDGSVALVRARTYRVEWFRDGGKHTVGPVLTYDPVRIGKAEKEEWATRTSTQVMTLRTPTGARTISPPKPNIDDLDWPETKPPFEGTVSVTPEGEVWIPVSQPAGATRERYDVVDGAGRLVRRVELADGRHLVGFGRGTLYAVRTDADDLQWLERYEVGR
jgi:hypothetical protein